VVRGAKAVRAESFALPERRAGIGRRFRAAFLERIYALGWATGARQSRAVIFTKSGETKFANLLAR